MLFFPWRINAAGPGEAENKEEETSKLDLQKEKEKRTAENSLRQLEENYNNASNHSDSLSDHDPSITLGGPRRATDVTQPPKTLSTSAPQQQTQSEPSSNLGYIPLRIAKFKEVAGEPRSLWSKTYNQLLTALNKYENLPESASMEERLAYLENLSAITTTYLEKKQASWFKEGINVRYSENDMERAKKRVNGCSLLLNGIDIERSNLASGERDDLPRKGIRLDHTDLPVNYQRNFAGGNLSSLSLIKIGQKKYLFKESTNKKLPELVARNLGFPEELIKNGGISEIMANLSGRELATYKIAKELSKSTGIKLVPDVVPAALGEKPHQIIGNALEYIEGSQLCRDQFIPLPEKELESLFSDKDRDSNERKTLIIDYMAEVASARVPLPSEWRLLFPNDLLEQRSSEEPLYEAGKPMTQDRASELAREGFFSFEKREIFSINHDINFKEPLLQKTLNQLHLFLLLTGELDPNELNFIFFQDEEAAWRVLSIDHDLSFSREFSDVSDETIDFLRNTKEVKHILKMPLLVDQEMGDALLKLTPERLNELFSNTKLSKLEMEAAQNRLRGLQQSIQKAKEEGRYVVNPMDQEAIEGEENKEGLPVELDETATISETEAPLKKEPLYWGEQTYEMQKEDPETYLGKFLKTKEYLTQKLEGVLQIKINFQQQKIEEEKQKLNELFSHLARIREPQTEEQKKEDSFSFSPPRREIPASDRSHSTASIETAQTYLTALLPNLRQATTEFLCTSFLLLEKELERREVMPSSSFFESFFKKRLLLEDKRHQKAIFKTNQLLSEAAEVQKEAEPLFEKLIEEILSSSDSTAQWEKCLQQFDRAYTSLSFALTAFQEETSILPKYLLADRKPYQEKAQHDKDKVLANILWGQIYQAEKIAMTAFRKSGSYSEESLQHLLTAQQAWRVLFSNIAPSLRESFDPYFKKGESLKTHFTPFFSYWLRAAEARNQGMTSSSHVELSINNSTEKGHWNNLHEVAQDEIKEPKSETERGLWKKIMQEIDFQKAYASAQEKTIHVKGLKKDISDLSKKEIVYTQAHTVQPGNKLLLTSPLKFEDVDGGANIEKLEELCNCWDQYKAGTINMRKDWSQVVEYANENLTNLSNLKYEKPLEEQNDQALEATFLFQANRALKLAQFAEEIFPKIVPSPAIALFHRLDQPIETRDLDIIYHQLSLANVAINNTLNLSQRCETGMWRPSFPTKKLERFEEIKQDEGQLHDYVVLNFFTEEMMRSFLNQIDQFPNHSQFKTPLNEMIKGEPDFIKESRNSLIEQLHQSQDSISQKLELMDD